MSKEPPELQLESSQVAEMSSSPITSALSRSWRKVMTQGVALLQRHRGAGRKVENIELGGASAKELQEFRLVLTTSIYVTTIE